MLIVLDRGRVIAVQSGQIPGFQGELVGERGGVVVLVPARGVLVGGAGFLVVLDFFVQLGEVLFLGGGAAEVAFGEVVVDRLGEDAGGVLGGGFAVGFVGVLEGVGHVVGFVEFVLLEGCCLHVVSLGKVRNDVEGSSEEGRRGTDLFVCPTGFDTILL